MSSCPHGMTSHRWCPVCKAESGIKREPKKDVSYTQGASLESLVSPGEYRALGYGATVAKFDGRCRVCGQPIQQDELLILDPAPSDKRVWCCKHCGDIAIANYERDKGKQ